jgi:hypothetical protein
MKKTNITLSIALAAVFSSSVAFSEAEITGKIVHESARFTESGIGIGAATTSTQTADSHGKDSFKTETSAKIYIDGAVDEIIEGATYHVELNLMTDSKGVGKYDGNEAYTQRDPLREAYVDAEVGDYTLRVGKQQVVWGTADGMKLLDTINPTDYSEMAQNQMEDSRMPIWMINAESDSTYGDGGSFQLVISEAKSNKIAGMGTSSSATRSSSAATHTNGDAGNAFIMKGSDTLTGQVNGFMNIGPAMGKVATFFASGGQNLASITATNPYGNTGAQQLIASYSDDTVAEFVGDAADDAATVTNPAGSADWRDFRGLCGGTASRCYAYSLDNIAESDTMGLNESVTNLIDANGNSDANWNVTNPTSMFEYMDQTTFATFADFVNMETEYVVEDAGNANVALKYKNSTEDGLNYTFNFMNGADTMPYVDVSWKYSGGALTASQNATNNTVSLLKADGTDFYVVDDGAATLVMTEKHADITNIGGSFDTAVETATIGPVVLRGEFLYTMDAKQPVIDRAYLRAGNITEALKSLDMDTFKYVLGADITALTNMMISAQFIQLRNLDFVETTTTLNSVSNFLSTDTDQTFTGERYTADPATMHLSNGLQKGEENKEFFSLFLSKPFGASGEHRWNNIIMYEENGGKWNRLDAEFSINDETQVTVEWNKYFGNENTQFGQLAASSNVQLGFKYSF